MSLEIKLLVDGVTMHLLKPVSGCTKGRSLKKKKGRQSVDSDSILDLDPVCITYFAMYKMALLVQL